MAGALDGIKILELTRVGPGAFCTMMLSDMDAGIAALERRRDETRCVKQGMMPQLPTGRVRLGEPVEKVQN